MTIQALYSYGKGIFGAKEFEELIEKEMENLIPYMNSVSEGSNIGISIFKQVQRNATQTSLNYKYNQILTQETDRDLNIFMDIQDFLDLKRPKSLVLVKFSDEPEPTVLPYKRTETFKLDWLLYWHQKKPKSKIEYCTDIFSYTRIMGGLCGLVNMSNLLERLEVCCSYNLTILLVSLLTVPNADFNPMSRNAKHEKNEIIKSIVYEDIHRKMKKMSAGEDHLMYSRTRNLFSIPALQGTNSFSFSIN